MNLTDILRQRAACARQSTQVHCGALGLLTVEALPLRECALLCGGADASRRILYAACRELQRAGEELQREGSVFRPEEITQHISEEEATLAAEAILALSGWQEPVREHRAFSEESESPAASNETSQAEPPAAGEIDAPRRAAQSDVLPALPTAHGSGASLPAFSPGSAPRQPAAAAMDAAANMAARGAADPTEAEFPSFSPAPQEAAPLCPPHAGGGSAALAEEIARQLLLGLRQAARVR